MGNDTLDLEMLFSFYSSPAFEVPSGCRVGTLLWIPGFYPGTANLQSSSLPLSYHCSHQLPMLPWATAAPMSYQCLHEQPMLPWATNASMSNHCSHELPMLPWATTAPMRYHCSRELSLLPWATWSIKYVPPLPIPWLAQFWWSMLIRRKGAVLLR